VPAAADVLVAAAFATSAPPQPAALREPAVVCETERFRIDAEQTKPYDPHAAPSSSLKTMKWLALVAVAAGALRWDQPSGDGVRHGQALAFTPPSHACQPRMHSASSGAGSRWLASGRGRQAGALRGGARRNVGGSSRNGVCMMAEEIECDVVIVGGGPAGCTCALYTSRADLKVGLGGSRRG